ncbi:MAG: hypothetical protein JRN15_00055 [Nitrososphaerota archaeon]|nr:hypothetical protein [Nitrososphaerota archaeon]
MVEYKWVALSNTTLGVLMSSIDSTIVLISVPAIFRGIDLDPTTSFQYLLWIMFGYIIVTATLLVTFGRISDIHGRVRFRSGTLGFHFSLRQLLVKSCKKRGRRFHILCCRSTFLSTL